MDREEAVELAREAVKAEVESFEYEIREAECIIVSLN